MHLRSIAMKGFKSFPERTKLEFSPGVAVVVGPNGSGKSNITDAVLWALGEQSPLAVRGQTMKDVIFAGGAGVKGSSAAEVEVVIDNSEGRLGSDFSEISIVRRLDRDGEGEYRLNGARCRLVDVAEVLSDTGLGKEMHSVVSQGRVESIVLSRPRERRLLIEEAAGLGKHRRRRRASRLKLERTSDNLARALDVEREARSRLRPLKRQAEAAQLHERIQRQSDEARYELARDVLREARGRLSQAEAAAAAARLEREAAERLLAGVARRREAAEDAFATITREREEQAARLYAARSAAERIGLRLERARDQARAATDGGERRSAQLALLRRELADGDDPSAGLEERIAALELELAALDGERDERVRDALVQLEAQRGEAVARRDELEAAAAALRDRLAACEAAADDARRGRRAAEARAEAARAAAAAAGAELAAVNQFVRTAAGAGQGPSAPSLSEHLDVEPGYETAVAAVLGPRLRAGVVEVLADGQRLLDRTGEDGGSVLVVAERPRAGAGKSGAPAGAGTAAAQAGAGTAAAQAGAPAATEAAPPCAGAEPLLARVAGSGAAAAIVERLLADVWVVPSLDALPASFQGVAVTRPGRVWSARSRELRQPSVGGPERLLEQRNRQTELVAASEAAARDEAHARGALAEAAGTVTAADGGSEEAEVALRRAVREVQEAAEDVSRAEWLMERRREAPDEGPDAVRRAELAAEVRSERRMAEGAHRERLGREARADALAARIVRDETLAATAARATEALAGAGEVVDQRAAALERERAVGAQAGEETARALRACAHEEAEIQGRLRAAGGRVTTAEVLAQQARDAAADAERTLAEVSGRLELEAAPSEQALAAERREELEARIERLARRREQLGPINPLAAAEYDEAVAHVEELEAQRTDLEGALAELEGLIRETDRRIRESFEETFAAAARNFEEVTAHLFPGGRGRLRLVRADQTPRPVLGGGTVDPGDETEPEEEAQPAGEEPGVEVEVTPAGKSTKRLSLLSGGEKSLVALAFMFAVFLARPCPFYILDEVEAALDDLNIDRFLQLVRRYSDRAQFIVVTHQKRTMDAADILYGVSMGGDGISQVVSRKLGGRAVEVAEPPGAAAVERVAGA